MADAPRLYAVLEISPTATQDEVKKAYRRLALINHPDKAGEAGRDKFLQIQEAYATLGDETKRRVYDAHGEKGLEMLNNPYTGAVASNLEAHVLMILLSVGLILFSLLLILFTAFLAAKVDGDITWGWGAVFIPVWLWDIGLACLMGYALLRMCSSKPPPEMTPEDRKQFNQNRRNGFLGQVVVWGYILFTVFLGVGISGTNLGTIWLIFFAPAVVAEVIMVWLSLPNFSPTKVQTTLAVQQLNAPRGHCVVIAISNCVLSCWRIPFLLLILVNIVSRFHLSWYVVALPMICALIAAVCAHSAVSFIRVRNDPKLNNCHAASWIIQQALGLGCIFISVILVCHKFEGGARTLGMCLVPIFILEGFLFITSLLLLCASCRMADQELRREEEMDEIRNARRGETEA